MATSKAQAARDYKTAHPFASVARAAEDTGIDAQQIRKAWRVGPASLARRSERSRVTHLRKHKDAPARVAVRAMAKDGRVFTLAHVQSRTGCSRQSARSAVERAIEAGIVERAAEHRRGAVGIYRGAKAQERAA